MAGVNDEISRQKHHKDSLSHLKLNLNGIATTDFLLKVKPLIDAELGKYNDDGITMLTVAKGEDPRGENCPARQNLTDNVDTNRKHVARNKRCHDLL